MANTPAVRVKVRLGTGDRCRCSSQTKIATKRTTSHSQRLSQMMVAVNHQDGSSGQSIKNVDSRADRHARRRGPLCKSPAV